MRLPNKVTSYKESILSKFVPILLALSQNDMSPMELYLATQNNYNDVMEYIDALDCLFGLNRIIFIEELEVLHYVV